MKKKILTLIGILVFITSFNGCNLKENLEEEFTDNEITETQTQNQTTQNETMQNETIIELGNNCRLDDIGIKKVYGKEVNCYNLNLDNIGIQARIPNYAISKEINIVNGFNEITFSSNEDFDKEYVLTDETSFCYIQPSGYFILSQKMPLSEQNISDLNNKNINSLYNELLGNSFIEFDTTNYSLENRNDIQILKVQANANLFNIDENSKHEGYCIIYFTNNEANMFFVGASNFSFKENVSFDICEYIIMSSSFSYEN